MKNLIPKGNIVILIISSSIGGLGNVALSFLPIYFTSLGGSVLQYGMISAFTMLIGIPSTIIGGVIVQRHSWKNVAVLSSWLSLCIFLGYYFSNSWITLSIPILLGALGTIGSTAWRLLVADTTVQENRTAQLSLYQTLTTIPSIFSPLVGGYLVHTMGTIEGFRFGILIVFAISPISTFLLMRFLREDNRGQNLISTKTKSSLPQSDNEQDIKRGLLVISCLLTALLKNRKLGVNLSVCIFHLYFRDFYKNLTSLPKVLVPLLAAYMLVIMANSTINPYLIFFATNVAKIDSFQWGIILSSQLLLANIIRTPLGAISDKFDKRKVLVLSLIMTAPLSILLIFQSSFLSILGILLAMIITGVNYGPTHEALQIEITSKDKRPALFAIYDVLTSLSRSSGIIIGAVLFTVSYALPFYIFTLIEACAVIILALGFLGKRRKKRSTTLAPQ